MIALLRSFSWQELRHHPWRSAAAVVAVMLGVALGFAVHVINASALDEFSQAVRSVNGQPDLELRPAQGTLPDALYGQVAALPQVALASPLLELTAQARGADGVAPAALRIIGVDALVLPAIAPALMPRAFEGSERLALFTPATVFLNAAALDALRLPADGTAPSSITLQTGLQSHT
ncbi:MAG: ABC transporter permease, partial [Sphingobacteriales bacterium]